MYVLERGVRGGGGAVTTGGESLPSPEKRYTKHEFQK